MLTTFTRIFIKSIYLKTLLLGCLTATTLFVSAQKDSLAKQGTDSAKKVSTSVRSKDIVKLEDVNIPEEMFAKIKMMKPNQMVSFRESYTYNIKAEDNIEYSITIKLGFSQDMITGIVRWVPLYSSSDAPPEITQIKIPVKFCCTTKIDTLHKKQHCGKMSELNDFEDYEHCKDWIQAEDAGKGDKAAVINKKGKGANGKDSTGFGKPEKPLSKKELKKKGKKGAEEEEDATDSTGARKDSTEGYGKPEKISKKDAKKKGKEEEVKKDSTDEGGYGKPAPAAKEPKKKKGKEKERPAPTDSTNYRPEPTVPEPAPKEEKKEEVKKDSSDGGGFGKPEEKKGKKKKKDKDKKEPTDTTTNNIYEELSFKESNKEESTEKNPIVNHVFLGELQETKSVQKTNRKYF